MGNGNLPFPNFSGAQFSVSQFTVAQFTVYRVDEDAPDTKTQYNEIIVR